MNALERLQDLFRELFQFDVADLDFGIYRLLHMKRDEVEEFLTKDLPATVEREFRTAAGAERDTIEKDVRELAERVRQDIGPDALQPSGEPTATYANAKLVKDYASKRKQLAAIEATEAQKAEVFNYLYAFFRRYYDDGDFIPRRYYGARESYAVPYNGEEVLFHWANRDQHYVKTGEAFRDYAFKIETLLGTFTVTFKLTQATTVKDNTKGDVRFFFALPKDAQYDKIAKVFVVPFEYRLPTEAEVQRYGSGAKGQAALTAEAAKKILAVATDDTLKTELAKVVDVKNPDDTAKREEVTLLLKRLRHFTKKNTTDYFIHKNLGGFLRQELEFYIKDQVVQAADLEGDFDAKRRMLRVLRALAEHLITFLHQIEEAQRRLFEKRKFVLRTDYLLPIQNVPRQLWPEVLANKAQVEAWKDLFAIEPKTNLFNQKGKVNERFLEEHPTLVVDTIHFGQDFKDRLLAGIDDLDGLTDGLLMHSENYQALRFLEPKYAGKVKCIYIDPPYNTGSDEFLYKDRYQHSCWTAMIEERLAQAKSILARDGAIFVSIDDNEQSTLKRVMDEGFGPQNFVATVIWQKVYSPKSTARHFSVDHDYVVVYARDGEQWRPTLLPRTEEANARYENPDDDPRGPWKPSDLSARNYYSKGQYEVTSPSGKRFRNPQGTYWRVSFERFIWLDKDNRIWWGPEGDNMPALKRFLSEVKQGLVPETLWPYSEVGHTQEAKQELLDIVRFERTEDVLNTVKPTRLIRRILQVGTSQASDEVMVDFFAGSGTTADAVIRQNRDDGHRRRFVLVEMGQYFRGMILQRVCRAMYAPEWVGLKPKRLATKEEVERTPHLVKVQCLESYEDALHNATRSEALGRATRKAEAVRETAGEERYRLSYLVRLPLEASDTMLSVEKLEHPFSYTIEVLTDDGPREQVVDLVETFNWLYGVRVKRLLTWDAKQGKEVRKYRVVVATDRENRKRILVVWRDMGGLDPKAERAYLETEVAKLGDFEEKWINGDCAVPGFSSLDGLFKRLMEIDT